MSKELEALEQLKAIKKFDGGKYHTLGSTKEIKIIEKGLKRLEAIDNAKPSEALKELEYFEKDSCLSMVCVANSLKERDYRLALDTIKSSLIKAQEQEEELEKYKKVLEIAIKKEVNIRQFSEEIKHLGKKFTYEFYLLEFDNYHYFVKEENKLTQEEFELLKRYLDVSSK